MSNGGPPFAPSEMLSHNLNDPGAQLYSKLNEMETFRSADDEKFTFLLLYPPLDSEKGFLFKQEPNVPVFYNL